MATVSQSGVPGQTFFIGSRGRIDSVLVGTRKSKYLYDSRFRVTSETDPGNHTTTYTYDIDFGNQKLTTAPGNRTAERWFDGYGRTNQTKVANMPVRNFTFDVFNRVKTIIENGFATAYTYGDIENLTTVTDAVGNAYQFTYNGLGQVIQEIDPHGAVEFSRVDQEGRFSTWLSRVPDDTVFTSYDKSHRPTVRIAKRKQYAMRRDSLFYDAAGLWVAGHNSESRDTIFTDNTGWTTSVITRFATDWNKRIVRSYTKDNLNRVTGVAVTFPSPIQATTRYTYSAVDGVMTS
ncbi:MAG: hypothetical protein ACT4OZ_07705 [Gemmatimonadota bacterium]